MRNMFRFFYRSLQMGNRYVIVIPPVVELAITPPLLHYLDLIAT